MLKLKKKNVGATWAPER